MTTQMRPAAYAFAPEILREYDIRGQIGKNLSATDAYAVGCAYGTYVKRNTGGTRVCLGYDGRETSPAFQDAVTAGLIAMGITVERIGLGPTPMLYFAVKHRKADAGIMITGSHNPGDYNGFKMTLQNSPVFGSAVQEIGRIAAAADYETGTGSVTDIDIQDDYVARLLQDFKGRPMKVAWDCGNGAAGEIARRLVARLPGEHILLFDEIDGRFPNHHPDPTVDENLADLIRVVRDQKCDLGIAFDGDADRIGAVDENGNVMRCDTMMTLYARDVLSRHPGAPIIGDVKCSQVMYDEIARLGGQPVMWKTGHSLIKAKMYEMKAPLAGELSGHIFFADGWYGFDDGLYCAIRLLNCLTATGGTASQSLAHLPHTFNTPELRFEVDEAEKFALIDRITESIREQAAANPVLLVNDIDGVRVTTADGWWLIRASNTQNVLVTRCEGQSKEGLDRLIAMVKNEASRIGCTVAF